ncbi:hypothetical protein EX30DRAFT_351623 [Ascodesmis nigricans]|uniref:Uncharacterized protein n=1 Tax=Ascodesmis nigricans TaxID=341454 RepID=A0A4S2MQM0_9PEZI|nr:hypothetical protein EX30DRAFT_351623 [Ascodesmis nigricans]
MDPRSPPSNSQPPSPTSTSPTRGQPSQPEPAPSSPAQSTSDPERESSLLGIFSRLRAAVNPERSSGGGPSGSLLEDKPTSTHSRLSLNYSGDEVDNAKGKGLSLTAFQDESSSALESSILDSSEPDLNLVLRVGSVTKRSVGSSTVRDPSPQRLPEQAQAQSSLAVHHGDTTGGRSSLEASSNAATVSYRYADDEAESSDDDDERTRRRGPGDRQSLLSTKTDELDLAYESSSSSSRASPHLLPRPLRLDSAVRRPPNTPVNSILTPDPIVGVVPPTVEPSVSVTRRDTPESRKTTKKGGYRQMSFDRERPVRFSTEMPRSSKKGKKPDPAVMAARRSFEASFSRPSSAPRAVDPETTPPDDTNFIPAPFEFQQQLGSLRILSGTPRFDSDEFQMGVNQIPTPPPRPRMPCILNIHGECTCSDGSDVSLSPQLSDYSIRYETDNPPRRSQQKKKNAADIDIPDYVKPSPKLSSKSLEGTLPPGGPVTYDSTGVPVTALSFTRMITDLEDVLNQALEIAETAVDDSAPMGGTGGSKDTRDHTGAVSNTVNRELWSAKNAARQLSTRQGARRMNQKPTTIGAGMEPLSDPGEEHVTDVQITERAQSFPVTTDSKGRVRIPKSSVRVADSGTGEAYELKSRSTHRERDQGRSEGTYGRSALSQNVLNPQKKFTVEVGRDGDVLLIPLESPGNNEQTSYETSRTQRPPHRGGWDWGLHGKRFSAAVTGVLLALAGWIIGNYHGELPAIQKHLELSSGAAQLGNVAFFLTMALSIFVFWPLPLLHGRKPYIMVSLALMIPLQLPQGLPLPPYTAPPEDVVRSMTPYAVCFMFFRALSGLVFGFAFVNTFNTVLDLFGADTGACCRGGVVFDNSAFAKRDTWRLSGGGRRGMRPDHDRLYNTRLGILDYSDAFRRDITHFGINAGSSPLVETLRWSPGPQSFDSELGFGEEETVEALLAIPFGGLLAVFAVHPRFFATNFRNRSIPSALHNLNYGHKNAGRHPYRLALRVGATLLPVFAIALTASISGPTPGTTVLAAIVTFFAVIVLTECHLLIMDNYDVSDLPDSHLTARSQASGLPSHAPDQGIHTSHPCLASALTVLHTMCMLFAALAYSIANPMIDGIGAQKGLAVVTGVLALATVALVAVLWRGKRTEEVEEMERRGVSLLMRAWGSRWWESAGRGWEGA